jgi:hypothetical protein
LPESGPKLLKRLAQCANRHANAAHGEAARVTTPGRIVMTPVPDLADRPEVLPDPPISFFLIRNGIGKPPQRMPGTTAQHLQLFLAGHHPPGGPPDPIQRL